MEILYAVLFFAVILIVFKIVFSALSRQRQKRKVINELQQYNRKCEAESKFKKDFTNLFSSKVLTSDDISRLRTSLSSEGLDSDLLFDSYKKEIQEITVEYLSIFWVDEEKATRIYKKITKIATAIKSYVDADDENIKGLISSCNLAMEAIEKARAYKGHILSFDNSIQLKPKEEFYYSGRCILYDNSKGVEIGSLVNQNSAFCVSDKGYIFDNDLLEKDNGNVILTNKRIIFSSPSITREMKYEDIISITAGENCIQITRTGKTWPEVFFFKWSYVDFWPEEYHTQLFVSVLLDSLHSNRTAGGE